MTSNESLLGPPLSRLGAVGDIARDSTWAVPRCEAHARRFGLDLARAAAILLVLVSHAAGFWLAFGPRLGFDANALSRLLGVDGVELFFGLSGFLIGRLLLDIQRKNPSFDAVKIFLVRRWLRTLPLYFLVLAALLLVPQLQPIPLERGWSYLLLVQNLVTPMPASNWFGTSWSLTIEEWSYLLLPFLAFFLCRRTRNPVASAAIILIALGIAIRLAVGVTHAPWTADRWDNLIRKTVITRADAVAYGVLAAVVMERFGASLPKYRLLIVALALLAANVAICLSLDNHAGVAGWLLLFPVTGIGFALLMPWLAGMRSPRGLLAVPVHFVARVSYALYLAHWPMMFMALAVVAPGLRWCVVYLAGSFAAASALSYAIEYPIMRLRPKQV